MARTQDENPVVVEWADALHVQYAQVTRAEGVDVWTSWRVDLASGVASKVHTASAIDVYYSKPTASGHLTVHREGSTNSLVEIGLDGREIKRYGEIIANRLPPGGSLWRPLTCDRFIYATHLPDRDGLDAFPQGPCRRPSVRSRST
jgi:hypothetical protein